MKCVVEVTNTNYIFIIPNYCIVDPVFIKNFEVNDNSKEIILEIIICNVFKMKESKFKVSNKITGKDLKNIYYESEKLNKEKNRLRLLSKGQEILDDHFLYMHELNNGSRIQVSILEL